MNTSRIKMAALKKGCTLKELSRRAEIGVLRGYRLFEGFAVPNEDELERLASVTGLTAREIREDLEGRR